MAVKEGQGRVWRGSPSGSAPFIFTSWSSELLSEALAPVEGGVSPGRASVGDRPLRKGAGCFFGGFRSFPRRPGRDGGGRQFCCILSFCPLLGRVRFACFFLLDCWCTAPLRPLPRALRELGCFGGPAGVPGLEERRAEWLTTSNFCFSVGLGWAGLGDFFFHVSKFLLPPSEEPLLFILSFLLSILSEEPGLKWDKKEVILRTAGASPFSLLRGPSSSRAKDTNAPRRGTSPFCLSLLWESCLPRDPAPSARVQLAFPWAPCPAGGTPVAGAGTGADLGSGHVSNCLGFCVGPGGWEDARLKLLSLKRFWEWSGGGPASC